MRRPLNSFKTPLKTRGADSAHDGPPRTPRAPGAVFEGVLALASCRASSGAAGEWFETFPPYGRYPVGGTVEGAAEGAEFVLDEAAAKAVIAAFRRDAARPGWPGVLVDREHFSADRGRPSDAMAWARDIRQEADGSVWTRWEFTAPGRALWEGRVLVSRSPLFACERDGRDYRPVALRSIAMTNTPHFTGLSTIAAARAAGNAGNGGKGNGMKNRKKEVAEALERMVAAARRKAWTAMCVTDRNGASHGEDGKFDGGNGGGGKAGSGDLKSRMRRNTGTAPDGDRGWETDRDGRAVGGFRMGRSTQNVAEEGARLVARFRGGDRRARAQGINEQLSFNRSRIRGEKDYWNRQTESEMRRATHRAAMYLGLRYDLRTHRYE